MKTKIISFMLLIATLFILVNSVSASTYYIFEGFESGTNGQPISDSFMVSKCSSGATSDFAVKSSGARTGSKSFYIATYKDGWMNLTYTKPDYIKACDFYDDWTYSQEKDWNFYNNTLGVGTPIINLRWSGGYYDYQNNAGTWTHIKAYSSVAGYLRVYFNVTNLLGTTVDYYAVDTKVTGQARNPSYFASGYRIDRIRIDSNDDVQYMDDFNFTITHTNVKPVNQNVTDDKVYTSTPIISVGIIEIEGQSMNNQIRSNYTGSWVTYKWTNATHNTTITYTFTGITTNKTFWWSSNTTDGTDWTNNTYKAHFVVVPSISLSIYEDYINCVGNVDYSYNYTTGFKIWFNATGNNTPIHLLENIGYAFGEHEYILNSTGYWIWANYTSALTKGNNIVNATGTHESLYDSVGDTWRVWANYTGDTTPLTHIQNIINATGTFYHSLDNTGYHIWANYTGDTTPFHHFENIVNATGTHDYLLNSTGYYDWANYTGDTTPLNIFENIGYSYGTHEFNLGVTGYNVWANYTSGLTKYENIASATGTHESIFDGYDWIVWANYTGTGGGSPLQLYLNENIINATGTHEYYVNETGYVVFANYTGDTTPLTHIQNIINATGTFYHSLDNTGYHIWANYTGVTTPLNHFENIINATGYHNHTLNSTGYHIWANYTGYNGSFDPNATDVWLYLGAMLTVDDSQFYLLILVSLWAFFIFIYADKKETLYAFCIICFGLPLGIIISGIAFFNSYPFGYLISFIIILVSFLIPSYTYYKKGKK